MPASRRKYVPVVSLSRMSGFHAATVATAFDRWTIALVRSGIEPWPEMPVAVSSIAYGIFSSVCDRRVLHLAADARDAAALGEAVLGVDLRIVLVRP